MKFLMFVACVSLLVATTSPAIALTQGTSTVSNCGGEAGNWIDVAFTTTDGVRLVDVWWDFNGSIVWLDQDGVSMCTPENTGVTAVSPYFDHDPPVDTQDWGCAFTGFDGGDYIRLKMDLDRGTGGTPFSEDFYGGTVTVEFSDGSSAVGTFNTDYDWPNGCTATFTVLAPAKPNLAFNLKAGWDAPFVPREHSDATTNNVPAPLLLPGDATATWLNLVCQNDGSAASGPPTLTIHCDGVLMHTMDYVFGYAPGAYFGPLNLGPDAFTAGRHTMRATADPNDEIDESNESDNLYAVQYSWASPALSYNSPETRAHPPLSTADLALVPGTDENCAGARIIKDGAAPGTQSDWMVVWNQRVGGTGDSYFMRLFDATNSPVTGFSSPLATTQQGQGLEAFIIHTRQSAQILYDVGIFNPAGATEDFEIDATYEGTTDLAFGSEVLLTGEHLRIVEFFAPIGHFGPATLTIEVDPALGPVKMGWLGRNHDIGNLSDLNDVVETDIEGRAKIMFDIAQVGYHAAVFYQDHATTTLSATVGLYGAKPDLEPVQPAGWAAPLVPRSSTDATPTSCPLPAVLHGDADATWLNTALRNSGNDVADTTGFGFAIDGTIKAYTVNGSINLDPGDRYTVMNYGFSGLPINVPGGRHTLTSKADWHEDLAESFETNNWTGAQYCWTPVTITVGLPVTRNAPPDRDGGHAECDPGQTLYDNCDGVRLGRTTASYWRAISVMPPGIGVDVDVELHQPLTSVQNGFGPNRLAESTSGPGEIDFVIVNDNVAPDTPYDVGILDDVDVSFTSYDLTAVSSTRYSKFPVGQSEQFLIPRNHMLDLNEYRLAAGPQLISVTDDGANVDWGISIYGNGSYFGKADHLPDGISFAGGNGEAERIHVDIPVEGDYCIAVWKVDENEMHKNGTYRLNFAPGVTGTGDQTPGLIAASRLNGATPNPFNPQTTIHFELVEDVSCQLAIYDLQGRLVRNLVSEPRRAGPNQVIWDGRDESSRFVASGVYLAHLTAGSAKDQIKVTLVK